MAWVDALDLSGATWSEIIGAPAGRNYRTNLDAALISVSGDECRLVLRAAPANDCVISDVAIGEKAGSGDAWDFAAAPVNVQVSGSDDFTISAGANVTTDTIALAIDDSKSYIVAFHRVAGGNETRISANPGGAHYYATPETDETEVVAPDGYDASAWRFVEKLQVQSVVTPTGAGLSMGLRIGL